MPVKVIVSRRKPTRAPPPQKSEEIAQVAASCATVEMTGRKFLQPLIWRVASVVESPAIVRTTPILLKDVAFLTDLEGRLLFSNRRFATGRRSRQDGRRRAEEDLNVAEKTRIPGIGNVDPYFFREKARSIEVC